MKASERSVVLIAILLVTVATPAGAVVILDQENFIFDPQASGSGSATNGTFGRVQTFTVGVAGTLDSVALELLGTTTSARILATSGGAPIGGSGGSTVLASTTVISNVGDIFTFDFSGAGLAVSVGDVLAMEQFGGTWRGDNNDPYAGGTDYFFETFFLNQNWTANPIFDWNFRTFVDVGPAAVPVLSIWGRAGFAIAMVVIAFAIARRRRAAALSATFS